MKKDKNRYTVFEHEALYVHRGEQKLSDAQLKAFQLFYKERDFPYYSLVHNGIRFCEYVGVIKVGNLTIEVLPKADKSNGEEHWRSILIDMMRSTGLFHPDSPSYSSLKVKNSTILDMYLELFATEVERLMHQGLIKKYRKTQSNSTALKGKLLIGKQVTLNAVHQEHFYIEHTVYDKEHLLHQILSKALTTVVKIGTASHLISRYKRVLLDFPEQRDIKVNESLFDKIKYDRKSQSYQTAVDIAKIILLNFHPDLSQGSSHVLALMFDMNALWEKFVLRSLQRNAPDGLEVSGQVSKDFWTPETGYTKKIRPDIVIRKNNEAVAVLDTKWKNIGDANPSDDDLRQLYAYSRYHNNVPSYLVYPGNENKSLSGMYSRAFVGDAQTPGGVIKLKVHSGKRDGMELLNQNISAILF
ncbi:McrC family protein [Sphingobacterium tabacisoli]|uniref:McrC family protein n=1 Tax=Sphingobacterium tabacisoli TaxID=2044855 RepID=A0ABW5L2G3_9SPHI|nr:hypothetical protein [Sphingobacterium tabacisoli]